MTPRDFVDHWKRSEANEDSNRQSFLDGLCELIGVDPPDPARADTKKNQYVYERRVDYYADQEGERGFMDLYKKECFVLEAKQGAYDPQVTEAEELGLHEPQRSVGIGRRGTRTWERAMTKAKNQSFRYARALPDDHGWPPFLIVVDIGHCIDLYADFARQGKNYVPFPDQQRYRIPLEDLTDPDVRAMLRQIWTNPLDLDPTRTSTKVTRELATNLAKIASSLEAGGHEPDRVAGFLMRCLFTMFAEDVGLLPERSFTELLERCRSNISAFPKALENLWTVMDEGGYEPSLMADIQRFNGQLYHDPDALPITETQLELLIKAAEADWADVEPAIFGTLLERALDPRERHKLGAHFTPRAYVERLVVPTVIEPLREEWDAAQTAATEREKEGDEEGAYEEIESFHRRLCQLRVLDPACGSGNFLYVTLEHLKRLEAEVLDVMEQYGVQTLDMTGGYRVSPEQLLGLEINPRAAAIADVVLWIGYLQWHFRTHGDADRLDPPILEDTHNIQHRDAVLDYDDKVPRTDEDGNPITRWDRRTYKEHPTTQEMVPDESAQEPVYDYTNPEPAEWPEADFIVGNPPFIGAKDMREALGDGYTEAVRDAYLYKVRKSADFVMFWWYKAAKAVRGKLDEWEEAGERFGLITTNSIRQTFNRKVMEKQIKGSPPVNLVFAIPDHPWVASADASDVRISMTVGTVSDQPGTLQTVAEERASTGTHWDVELEEETGNILPDLTIGADVAGAEPLDANSNLSGRGLELGGSGFIVGPEKAHELGLGKVEGLEEYIRPYRNGRDLAQYSRDVMVIDLHGLDEQEVRYKFPSVYQHLSETVKPERQQNRKESLREYWWLHRGERAQLRDALDGLSRYIATVETSKHRFFQFLDSSIAPDNKLVVFAFQDAYHLGVLSCRIHVEWSLAAGGNLGVGNDPVYAKTQCFDPFPFPAVSPDQKAHIRQLGEQLDEHRKSRLDEHEDLTMTELYNVLERVQDEQELTEDEREIHEKGLVSVLAEIHDELDAAVAKAYGWRPGVPKEEILQRLVDLNEQRRAEEEEGFVRWLRPEYQAPEEVATQSELELDIEVSAEGEVKQPLPWPSELKQRAQALRQVVSQADRPLTVEQVASHFHRARRKDVRSLLETLETLGIVEEAEEAYTA
jgi:hypothetical protein